MKKTAILACSLILSLQAFALPQTEDYLVMGDEGHFIRADPLNKYLRKSCKDELLRAYVNNFSIPYSPDYTRYWEIKDNRLYLLKIETDNKEVAYPLELLFPLYDGKPVEAKWFSGILSHRLGDSPVIRLNRDYYEEESVLRLVNGVVVERFATNHRERWISYARRIMENHYPLLHADPDRLGNPRGVKGGMAVFLDDAFSVVTKPEEEPPACCPIIKIEFNADLEGFHLKESHREFSCQELLEAVAEETQTVLDVAISNRMVIYVIKETEMPSE